MNVWNEKPLIRSSDIGLIRCKILNIYSVCVIFYSGNLRPNSPTHKSMEKAVFLQRQSFFVAPLFYLCYNKSAIKDKRITFLFLAELSPLSGTQGRSGALFFYLIFRIVLICFCDASERHVALSPRKIFHSNACKLPNAKTGSPTSFRTTSKHCSNCFRFIWQLWNFSNRRLI